jgi:prepilin-type N-terminal cleavage/methylation domain-containing protein
MKHKAYSMKQSGFTLVELVVVLALFMLIISVTVGMFISIVQHQKRILSQQDLLSQMSYVQEYMSRSLRSAARDAAGDCLFDGQTSYPGSIYLLTHYNQERGMYQGIKFISKDNVCQEFFLDSGDGLLKEIKDGGAPQAMVSGKFTMSSAVFIVGDTSQPRVTMAFTIENQIFQTTVSQRNLNIQ